ncbi:MAG: hypothetical protein KOO69_08210, partial [Victivallales bacterium]|nr:hypothetical protein [Victivallales bacterium]
MTSQKFSNLEIPYIKGESKLVYPPAPDSSNELWFINDHCFITDSKGILHFFGINNPYPANRNDRAELYRKHPYLGHASSSDPMEKWLRASCALNDIDGEQYLGAPYIVWIENQKKYIMVFESKINGRRTLELAYSENLFNWKRTGTSIDSGLPAGTRDPFILKNENNIYNIYLCYPRDLEGSSVIVMQTEDFSSFTAPKVCLHIEDGIAWSGAESPFVVKRNGLYYLFFTYAHRHYYETVVCVSDKFDDFSMKNVVTTI